MENVAAIMLKENGVSEPDKNTQTQSCDGDFAELIAGILGLPPMLTGALPGLTSGTKPTVPDSLLGKQETSVNETLAYVKGVNDGNKILANEGNNTPAHELGEKSFLTLATLLTSTASHPRGRESSKTVTPEDLSCLQAKGFEHNVEGQIPFVGGRDAANKLQKMPKDVALSQVHLIDFNGDKHVNNEKARALNLVEQDTSEGEILQAQLRKEAENQEGLSGEKVNREANAMEQGSTEETLHSKENLSEAKQDFSLKLGETNWTSVVSSVEGKTPPAKVAATELVINAEQLTKDLPEIVLSKLQTFENKEGSKDVVIHLEPKELGKLIVKLTSTEGIVSVKIMAHYPLTRDLLESSLHTLRQSLLEQEISFDRLEVELGGQQLNQSQYEQQEQQAWRWDNDYPDRHNGLETNPYAENETPDQPRPDNPLARSGYDYLV